MAQSKTVHIKGLPLDTTIDDVRRLMASMNAVAIDCRLPTQPTTKSAKEAPLCKGFAYVALRSSQEAQHVVHNLNGRSHNHYRWRLAFSAISTHISSTIRLATTGGLVDSDDESELVTMGSKSPKDQEKGSMVERVLVMNLPLDPKFVEQTFAKTNLTDTLNVVMEPLFTPNFAGSSSKEARSKVGGKDPGIFEGCAYATIQATDPTLREQARIELIELDGAKLGDEILLSAVPDPLGATVLDEAMLLCTLRPPFMFQENYKQVVMELTVMFTQAAFGRSSQSVSVIPVTENQVKITLGPGHNSHGGHSPHSTDKSSWKKIVSARLKLMQMDGQTMSLSDGRSFEVRSRVQSRLS